VHETVLAETTLALRALLLEDVALEGLGALDLAGAGELEALRGTLVSLDLLLKALARLILPVPVSLKRFAVPL